jgi:hypothetical protein
LGTVTGSNVETWVLALRRSFGVPDIVGWEPAKDKMIRELLPLITERESILFRGWERKIADKALELVVTGAGAGELDGLVVGSPEVEVAFVAHGLVEGADLEDFDDHMIVSLRAIVIDLATRLVAFVHAHPYIDATGRYFDEN